MNSVSIRHLMINNSTLNRPDLIGTRPMSYACSRHMQVLRVQISIGYPNPWYDLMGAF